MFTNTFNKCFPFYVTNVNPPATFTIINQLGNVYSGNYTSFPTYGNPSRVMSLSDKFVKAQKGNVTSYGVAFGDGGAAESVNDYALSGNHMTKYTATCTKSCEINDNEITITMVFTITSNESTTFTIREIGWYDCLFGSAESGALIDRTVLESPVTIQPTGVGQVVYTMRFPTPSA